MSLRTCGTQDIRNNNSPDQSSACLWGLEVCKRCVENVAVVDQILHTKHSSANCIHTQNTVQQTVSTHKTQFSKLYPHTKHSSANCSHTQHTVQQTVATHNTQFSKLYPHTKHSSANCIHTQHTVQQTVATHKTQFSKL